MDYDIKQGGAVLGSFSVVEVSDPAIASGVATTLAVAEGTAVTVHTTGSSYLVIYGDQVVTVEEA